MSFGSPASDYVEENLDLNHYLISHQAATYFLRMSGDAMAGIGILDGDILVVDRALELAPESIIVAEIDGELTARRFRNFNNQRCLMPENSRHQPIFLRQEEELKLWGIVSSVIRKL